jgi:hypothetical protein
VLAAGVFVHLIFFAACAIMVLRAGRSGESVAKAPTSDRSSGPGASADSASPVRWESKSPATSNRSQQWLQRTLPGDFDRLARKGEPWEADGREVVRLAAEDWNNRYRDLGTLLAAAGRADRAGCDDPLVRFAAGRVLNVGYPHDQVAQQMAKSSYHPALRCLAFVRAARWTGNAEPLRQAALKLLPEVGADREVPVGITLDICDQLEDSYFSVLKDRKAAFDKVEPVLAKARPESSILYTYRGSFLTRYAWDARGGGYANSVTDEGWRGFAQRLALAQTALEKAWQLDSTNADAPRLMLTVELGQGEGRQRMELWFRRAMTADPDNFDACKAKLYYLEPKWHGSPEEMVEFGRECLRGGNWKARLPLILAEAHEAISVYNRANPDAYFARPGVWEDIRSAYEPYLKAYPKATYDRSKFTMLACQCGQWEAARQQFDVLGAEVQASAFGGRYEEFRQEAARRR